MYRDEGELEKYLSPYNPIWDIIICQEGESMNVLKIQYKMSVYYKILLLRNYSFFLTIYGERWQNLSFSATLKFAQDSINSL